MKNFLILISVLLLLSCTSNTIYKKPENLIPKDTMRLLIQEMFIASSAKNVKNINLEKNVNYIPFVYDKFKIDSTRFYTSNEYYMSKIDDYHTILTEVKEHLEVLKDSLYEVKKNEDSLKRVEIQKVNTLKKNAK